MLTHLERTHLRRTALIMPEEFQHILRVMNTNLKGEMKIWHALTCIRGVGIRYATLVCKKAEVDTNKRAGQMVRQLPLPPLSSPPPSLAPLPVPSHAIVSIVTIDTASAP